MNFLIAYALSALWRGPFVLKRSLCSFGVLTWLGGCGAFEAFFAGATDPQGPNSLARVVYVTPYPELELRSTVVAANGVAQAEPTSVKLFGDDPFLSGLIGDGIQKVILDQDPNIVLLTNYKTFPAEPNNQTSVNAYTEYWNTVLFIDGNAAPTWLAGKPGLFGHIISGCSLPSSVLWNLNTAIFNEGGQPVPTNQLDQLAYTVSSRTLKYDPEYTAVDKEGRIGLLFPEVTFYGKKGMGVDHPGPNFGYSRRNDPRAKGYAGAVKRQVRILLAKTESLGNWSIDSCLISQVGSNVPKIIPPVEKVAFRASPQRFREVPSENGLPIRMSPPEDNHPLVGVSAPLTILPQKTPPGVPPFSEITQVLDSGEKLEPDGAFIADAIAMPMN